MLTAVKTALGISSSAWDNTITALIASAKADLQLKGIINVEDTDPLIITAVSSYVEAYLPGTDADKSEKYLKIYSAQLRNLSLAVEYTEDGADAVN